MILILPGGHVKQLPENDLYEFDEFRLDVRERLLLRDRERIHLTEKAFDVLCVLVSRSGSLVTKDELFAEVWPDTIVEENSLDKNVSILRRVLGDGKDGTRFIETVRGRGYRFLAEVRAVGGKKTQPADDLKTVNRSAKEGAASLRSVVTNSGAVVAISDWRRESESNAAEAEPIPDAETVPEGSGSKIPKYALAAALTVGILALVVAGSFYLTSISDPEAGVRGPIKKIAVLPFRPLASEAGEDVLGIGMADALISRLSERREIEVRPLSAGRTLVSAGKDTVAIGQELGTDAVVEGGIQRSGDRIFINARLVKVADGSSLWTETFDGNYEEILADRGLIDRLTAAIALRLSNNADTAPITHRTENVEAWEYYLKGSYQVGQITPAKIKESIEYYNKAIDRDPKYALAYAGLSRAYISLAPSSDYPPTECFPKAKAAAQKALEIDERLAEGHSALGSILFWYEWDWAGAEEQCKHALQLNPNSADAHYTYAHLLSNLGRHTEALGEMKRARELDPITLRINALEGLFLKHAGRTDEALEKLRKTVQLNPQFWQAHAFLSSIYVEKGMYGEAIAEADLAKKFSGASNYPAALKGYALAKSGKNAEAQAMLDELSRRSNELFVPSYYFAVIYNGLGDTDNAISWLERGLEQRDSMMVFLKVEPKWNNLRNEPRFIDILKRMNLE